MPTDYLIDAAHRTVFALGIGSLSILDLLDSMTRLLGDSRFSPSFHHIADFSGVDVHSPQLSSADIRSLAARRVFDATSRRAFIIGASPAFDLARLYTAQRGADGESNVQTFQDLQSAAQWTGVDLEAAKQALGELRARLTGS